MCILQSIHPNSMRKYYLRTQEQLTTVLVCCIPYRPPLSPPHPSLSPHRSKIYSWAAQWQPVLRWARILVWASHLQWVQKVILCCCFCVDILWRTSWSKKESYVCLHANLNKEYSPKKQEITPHDFLTSRWYRQDHGCSQKERRGQIDGVRGPIFLNRICARYQRYSYSLYRRRLFFQRCTLLRWQWRQAQWIVAPLGRLKTKSDAIYCRWNDWQRFSWRCGECFRRIDDKENCRHERRDCVR